VDELRIPVAEGVALHTGVWPGSGSEIPFVLVHGLASNLRLWSGVADRLAGFGHAVVAVDLRGHGRSDKPDDGYDFATVASDLAVVVRYLELDRPVAVGQSWGANVVIELAEGHPASVRGVGCVDGGTAELRRHFPTWEECEKALAPPHLTGRPAEEMERMIRARLNGWPEEAAAAFLACFEIRSDGTVAPWLTRERHLMILRHLWGHSPVESLARLQQPVLLMPCRGAEGARLDARRASVAEAERVLANGRTVWFDADHDVHAQKPDEVAELLNRGANEGFWA